ncbi:MAG: pantetheine-phosphate adenylyltransferase [Deltaproteobacteria bacterium RIFCSPHIGHO2_12_FULL_43_9]|nr:MAG: pantetheine-phosphate adenylyltransferase [Deltaproteobacteria bacterium RIFCSPHIGHO2_12_FULL_43_9]
MKAIYPASFDPITNGHLDIIERALKIVDHLVLLIARSPDKPGLLSKEERLDILKNLFEGKKNITIDYWDGLIMEYSKKHDINLVIRGLRAISDFEYEYMMASMNKKLNPKVETIFMMTGETYYYLSSRTIKEVVSLGGSVKGLVPPIAEQRLREKLRK